MAGRDPARTAERARRLPLESPAPPAPDPIALPAKFVPEVLFSEARSTLTLHRSGGAARPPILVEESGCRVEGRVEGRPFAAVVDDPGGRALDRFAKLMGEHVAPLDAGDTPTLAERALAWAGPLLASMERWERGAAPGGARIVEARWEARVDLARVRIARRAGAPLPAAPDEGADSAGRSQDRSALEVRLHLRMEGRGRGVEVESARWGDPLQRQEAPALAALEDLWAAAVATAAHRLEAVSLPAMEGPVVFSPAAAGVLLHEICGHLLEGDLVAAGHSPFAGLAGEPVAPETVTLHDDPRRPGGRVRLLVDDEGEGTHPTVLIEGGRLAGFLTDRRSAAALGTLSSGNARRESYRHPALPRLTNLVMAPGREHPEDLLHGVERGLYVQRLGRGQVDPRLGRFRLEVETGRLVEKGRATRPVAGGYLVGRCLELLAAIDAVGGDQVDDPGAGLCIKEDQIAPVGQTSPSLRVAGIRILPGAGR